MSLLTAPMVGCGGDDSGDGGEGGAGGFAGGAGAAGDSSEGPLCGNGVREAGEACDDGNTTDEGSCSADCTEKTSCGDGTKQGTEECDDGNNSNRDECTTECLEAACGDGFVQAGEDCDDGNRVNDDSCSNECNAPECGDGIVNGSETCDGGDNCNPETCALISCGDGIEQEGEECDDGNGNDADECTNRCTVPVCGDGITQSGEDCDDANDRETDECRSNCTFAECGDGVVQAGVERCDEGEDNGTEGATCSDTCTDVTCGDGVTNGTDECDDGNANDADGCTNRCTLPVCGDGIRNGEDECDDGNTVNDDNCTNECANPVCGDGIVQEGEGEVCDEGAENSNDDPDATCNTQCALPTCGDGVVQEGEECDDENTVDTDSCLHTCVWNACGDGARYTEVTDENNPNVVEPCDDGDGINDNACSNACTTGSCGDGIVQAGEACDDGDDNSDEPGAACNTSCALPGCGDGIVDGEEECDDDNGVETDSCLSTCKWNSCGDLAIYTTVTDEGNPNPLEECDEDNDDSDDACISRNEPEYACRLNVCGDGFQYAGHEACDNGELNAAGAACNTECRPGTDCGNGVVDPGEECDLGLAATADATPHASNSDNGACSSSCTVASCGDGRVFWKSQDLNEDGDTRDIVTINGVELAEDANETCDDGNDSNTDYCDACNLTVCGDGIQRTEAYDYSNDGDVNDFVTVRETDGYITAVSDSSVGPFGNYGYINGFVSEIDLNGDGLISGSVVVPEKPEECDDNNQVNTDACLTSCLNARCGDGWLQGGVEECDEGADGSAYGAAFSRDGYLDFDVDNDGYLDDTVADVDGDGYVNANIYGRTGNGNAETICTSTCRLPACGDGFVQNAEQCDDSNTGNDDSCVTNAAGVTCRLATCGDGRVWSNGPGDLAVELCDDGNTVDTDACHNDCAPATCGNTTIDAGETCDDGDADNTDACTSRCQNAVCGDGSVKIALDLNADGDFLDTAANGVKEAAEYCDKGGLNIGDCTPECAENKCGDGWVEAGVEGCDDKANLGETEGACVMPVDTAGNATAKACKVAECGDGFVRTQPIDLNGDGDTGDIVGGKSEAAEACDDGAKNGTAESNCSVTCTVGKCGDRIIQPELGETCDDGNTVDGDMCSNSCKAATCGSTMINDPVIPGNDTTQQTGWYKRNSSAGGNPLLCSAAEITEAQALCDVTKTTFDAAGCAENGCVKIEEQCDDRDAEDNDSCRNTCIDAICGDGVKTADEPCDDGNRDNTDACIITAKGSAVGAANCALNTCGDGYRKISGDVAIGAGSYPLEECDMGGTAATRFCTNNAAGTDNDCKRTCSTVVQSDEVALTAGESCYAVLPADDEVALKTACDALDARLVMIGSAAEETSVEAVIAAYNTEKSLNATSFWMTCPFTSAYGNWFAGEPTPAPIANAGDLGWNNDMCYGLRTTAWAWYAVGDAPQSVSDRLGVCEYDTWSKNTDCGNGALNSNEECDDGNDDNGDGCSKTCVIEETDNTTLTDDFICPTGLSCRLNACGDGHVAIDEICDDGNTVTETGAAIIGGFSCDATCGAYLSTCGDGVTSGTEVCDDGNTVTETGTAIVPGVSCNAGCTALVAYCGDGNPNGDEECDDGNTSNADMCLNACETATCGDGFRRTEGASPEQCDAGTANVDSGVTTCTTSCRNPVCGDGFVQAYSGKIETCDDGDALDTGTCNATCSGDGTGEP